MTTVLAILILAGAYALGALTILLFMLNFNKICSRCWNAEYLISQLQEENRRMARELSRCWNADGLISQLQEENERMARELNNYRP